MASKARVPAMFTRMSRLHTRQSVPPRSLAQLVSDASEASARDAASAPAASASKTMSPADSMRNPPDRRGRRGRRPARRRAGSARSSRPRWAHTGLRTGPRAAETARDMVSPPHPPPLTHPQLVLSPSPPPLPHPPPPPCSLDHKNLRHAVTLPSGWSLPPAGPVLWSSHPRRYPPRCSRGAVQAPGDGLGLGHDLGATQLIESERGLGLTLRGLDQRGKRVFARPFREGRVRRAPRLEEDPRLPGGGCHRPGSRSCRRGRWPE